MKSLPKNNLLHEATLAGAKPLYGRRELTNFISAARKKGYIFLACEQYAKAKNDHAVVMRVDVDEGLPMAEKLAEFLNDLKIPASFFFRLHTKHYDLAKKEDAEIFNKIIGMGFEIGLHVENLFLEYDYKIDPAESLKEDIMNLEFYSGKKIVGAACHGEPWYYEKGINNLNFWKSHRPHEFGLLYEAYDRETFGLFESGIYISDSNLTAWKAYYKGKLNEGDARLPEEHVLSADSSIYVLIHPILFKCE